MPAHDWTLVDAGIFHAFHVTWVPELSRALNGGLLPHRHYALPEQHAGSSIADMRRHMSFDSTLLARRRPLAIRHVSGHRLVALPEIVPPGNKDRARHVAEFANKAVS